MKKILKILSFFLIFFTIQLGYSQLSKTHYIPPLSSTFANNAGSDNAPNEQWFHISTPSENAVNFTIKRGDGSDFAAGGITNSSLIKFTCCSNRWIRSKPTTVNFIHSFIIK